jgi:plasmid stabilization system protein ParE
VIELVWSPRSVADLEEIRAFIEVDSPAWADLTVRRLVAAVERLPRIPGFRTNGPGTSIAGSSRSPIRQLPHRLPASTEPC